MYHRVYLKLLKVVTKGIYFNSQVFVIFIHNIKRLIVSCSLRRVTFGLLQYHAYLH